jgi:thiol peroxidase
MPVERVGEVFELDERLTVAGRRLEVGDAAPPFALETFDAGGARTVTLEETTGRVRLLNVINSIDTPVCDIETKRWETMRSDMPPDTVVYTVSMDLPFAYVRWNAANGVTHGSLSAHKSDTFGYDYGVLVKEWRLLQRAVFVIGRDDRIVHVEYVGDQMREPDYEAAVAAVREASQ